MVGLYYHVGNVIECVSNVCTDMHPRTCALYVSLRYVCKQMQLDMHLLAWLMIGDHVDHITESALLVRTAFHMRRIWIKSHMLHICN